MGTLQLGATAVTDSAGKIKITFVLQLWTRIDLEEKGTPGPCATCVQVPLRCFNANVAHASSGNCWKASGPLGHHCPWPSQIHLAWMPEGLPGYQRMPAVCKLTETAGSASLHGRPRHWGAISGFWQGLDKRRQTKNVQWQHQIVVLSEQKNCS